MSPNPVSRRDPSRLDAPAPVRQGQGATFFDDGSGGAAGLLSEREKAQIAVAVAVNRHFPYSIGASTERCMTLGVTDHEMMQAVYAGSVPMASPPAPPATPESRSTGKKAG